MRTYSKTSRRWLSARSVKICCLLWNFFEERRAVNRNFRKSSKYWASTFGETLEKRLKHVEQRVAVVYQMWHGLSSVLLRGKKEKRPITKNFSYLQGKFDRARGWMIFFPFVILRKVEQWTTYTYEEAESRKEALPASEDSLFSLHHDLVDL